MMMLGAGAFAEAQHVGDVPMGKILRRIAAVKSHAKQRVSFVFCRQYRLQLSIHEDGGDGWAAFRRLADPTLWCARGISDLRRACPEAARLEEESA
jgi:hypothetical protein